VGAATSRRKFVIRDFDAARSRLKASELLPFSTRKSPVGRPTTGWAQINRQNRRFKDNSRRSALICLKSGLVAHKFDIHANFKDAYRWLCYRICSGQRSGQIKYGT
jgi:hypothetical protein